MQRPRRLNQMHLSPRFLKVAKADHATRSTALHSTKYHGIEVVAAVIYGWTGALSEFNSLRLYHGLKNPRQSKFEYDRKNPTEFKFRPKVPTQIYEVR